MRIHFIGIGGIGVSALAKYYLLKGHEVSGCDLVSSEITKQLKKMGVKVRIGPPKADCIPPGTEKIIYSPAVPKTHLEIQNPNFKIQNKSKILNTKYQILSYPHFKIQNKSKILNTKYQILSYPQALGELTKTHYTIAVSGTHGKSTTTAMIGLLLIKAGLDPTVIIGTKLKEFGDSNCRAGKSKYLVIEADEHFASFLNYRPKMIVLTTVEADHLDYYKTLGNIIKTFKKYILLLPKQGVVIANTDDLNTAKILKSKIQISKPKTKYYSLKQPEAAKVRKILKIPGEHNVANALAALAAARALNIPDAVSYASLSEYKGAWRRFEMFQLTINKKQITLVSDYGHHPTKVRATIEGARQKWPFDPAKGKSEIWLVYQPHQYARTYDLWKDFVKVLSHLPIQKLIITDIYDVAGRENKAIRKKVSSQKLVEEILNTKYRIPDTRYIPDFPPFKKIEDYLKKNLRGGEIVIVMGAGDIYSLTLRLTKSPPH